MKPPNRLTDERLATLLLLGEAVRAAYESDEITAEQYVAAHRSFSAQISASDVIAMLHELADRRSEDKIN